MWERPFASMNILKCATFRLASPRSLSSFATWVSWSTLCARLSRTFIVAVEQRQPGSSSLSSSDLYPFVPAQSCVPLLPLSLSVPPWHSYNCRIQCTHTHWMLYSFSLCLRLPACLLLLLLLLCLCASALAFVTCACEYLKYLCWLSMHLREYAEVELLIYQQRVRVCVCISVRLVHSYSHWQQANTSIDSQK